jgi:Ca2+:H+ antiporter
VADPLPRWVPGPLHVNASLASALSWLGIATVLTAIASELLVSAIEPVAHEVRLSTFFIGLIVLPIVGNAGEHFSAIKQAANNQMNATMAITAGSAIQVALLVTPVLVLLSVPLGHPLTLLFIPLELVIFTLVALLYAIISLDGESTWMEGLLLLVFYAIVAVSAFFVP